jgi:hypothetical protein
MSDADAEWFAEMSLVGDPVRYAGDDAAPAMESWNGLGGIWNIPWQDWVAGTA